MYNTQLLLWYGCYMFIMFVIEYTNTSTYTYLFFSNKIGKLLLVKFVFFFSTVFKVIFFYLNLNRENKVYICD